MDLALWCLLVSTFLLGCCFGLLIARRYVLWSLSPMRVCSRVLFPGGLRNSSYADQRFVAWSQPRHLRQ
jgi:hypothetical protein